MPDINWYFENDQEFKQYVLRYARKYIDGRSIAPEDALKHQIVKDYLEWMLERRRE